MMMLKNLIKKLILEEVNGQEWQYSKTLDVLKRTGLQRFIDSLDDDKRRELRDILSHHLLTGLTAPYSYAEMGDSEEAKKALENTKDRYEWLIKNLVGQN